MKLTLMDHRYRTPLDEKSWQQNGVVKLEEGIGPAVEPRWLVMMMMMMVVTGR